MKKSINITLNCLIFSLEDDAYEMLKNYLDSIKAYYEAPDEEKEILADIEGSIAGKFTEKLKNNKQVIMLSDVEEAIRIMGTVEEISEAEAEEGEKAGSSSADKADAEGENEKNEAPAQRRRLYRNPDDIVIAGVASGIAAYLGVDPVFIRIIFVILLFVNGIGILAYIIFWIAMPKAVSNAQKLEMRGKKVNLMEIEQAVKEKSKMIGEEGREAVDRIRKNNALRNAINFPFRIIETVFRFLGKMFSWLLPITGICLGIAAILISTFAVIGLSVVSAMMIFNIDSPYIISDFPLDKLIGAPSYYIGIISFYMACIIPAVFAVFLAITLIRRKNSFNLVASLILIVFWIASIVTAAVAAADLFPMMKAKIEEMNKQETITRSYDYKDFTKLYLSGNQDIKITKGDDFSIKLSGWQKDLDRLKFNIEDGQLQITQKDKNTNGFCIFCFDHEISGEIVMPSLDSFVGIGMTKTGFKDFYEDIYISLGEKGEAEMEMHGQDLKGALSGVAGQLNLSGQAGTVELAMNGSADLSTKELKTGKMILDMGAFSRADLNGSTTELEIKADDSSGVYGFGLTAGTVKIIASDFTNVEITAIKSFSATSSDSAEIYYKGNPEEAAKDASDFSTIEAEEDGRGETSVHIKTDVKSYSPLMSSIRGIGLTPEFYGDDSHNIIFRFTTNQGYLVDDFEDNDYRQEVDLADRNQKIYWTYIPGEVKLDPKAPIYINLEVRPEDEDRVITSTQIEFISDDEGVVTQKIEKK
jgi:phage shock protein PspC (stress-responsive transcriptional regulator)